MFASVRLAPSKLASATSLHLERAAGEIGAREVGAAQHARLELPAPHLDAREVASPELARIESRHQLTLERSGEVGNLLHCLLDIADAVDGQLEGCRVILALGLELTEPLMQVRKQVRFQLADALRTLVGREDAVHVFV